MNDENASIAADVGNWNQNRNADKKQNQTTKHNHICFNYRGSE